jgi:hypothetical protein
MSDTTVVTLSEAAWTSVGSAPALVAGYGGEALLVVASAAPAIDALGFTLRPNDAPLSIGAQGSMWARAISSLSTRAVVLPIGGLAPALATMAAE